MKKAARQGRDKGLTPLLLQQFIELFQLGLEKVFVRQFGLILGHECRAECAVECELYNIGIPRLAEEDSDAGGFMGLAVVPVQGLQIEGELADVLRLELKMIMLWDQGNSRTSGARIAFPRYVPKNCLIRQRFEAENPRRPGSLCWIHAANSSIVP